MSRGLCAPTPAPLPGFWGWCCCCCRDDLAAPYPGAGARSPGASSLPGPASGAHPLGRAFPGRLQEARSWRAGGRAGGRHSLSVHANRGGTSANSHGPVNEDASCRGAERRRAEGHGHGFLPRLLVNPETPGGARMGGLASEDCDEASPGRASEQEPTAAPLAAPVRTPVHRLRA